MDVDGRILVTEYSGKILVCHMIGKRPDRLFLEDASSVEFSTGTILTAKVKKIIPGIRAAFLSLGTEGEYFMTLPAKNDRDVMLVNRPYDGTIKCEDELVVQVKKQAVKMKQPIVDCHLSLAGRYAVIQTGQRGFHVSSKLSKQQKLALMTLQDDMACEDEIIIRTNAASVSIEDVKRDILALQDQMEQLKKMYRHRTCYSVLYRSLPDYLTVIRDIPANAYEEIVTDKPVLKEAIEQMFSEMSHPSENGVRSESLIRLYDDPSYPLIKLYCVETAIQELLQKKVWLKSGGFLVIDQTETLTAIDVNTGKNDKKRDIAFETNMEAVPEIGRQLRARNLSGMILIDFINLKKKEQTEALTEALKAELKKDYVRADFIDVTGLGLFEVTREKRHASLAEMLR